MGIWEQLKGNGHSCKGFDSPRLHHFSGCYGRFLERLSRVIQLRTPVAVKTVGPLGDDINHSAPPKAYNILLGGHLASCPLCLGLGVKICRQ